MMGGMTGSGGVMGGGSGVGSGAGMNASTEAGLTSIASSTEYWNSMLNGSGSSSGGSAATSPGAGFSGISLKSIMDSVSNSSGSNSQPLNMSGITAGKGNEVPQNIMGVLPPVKTQSVDIMGEVMKILNAQ